MTRCPHLLATTVLLAMTATARADEPVGEPAATEAPSLTLGTGAILIAGQTVNVNLSSDRVAEPISLAPSLWYGVDDRLTLGVTHDGGRTPLAPRPAPGAGICITGEDHGCGNVYDNISLDVLYGLVTGTLDLAVHGAIDIDGFDPLTLDVRAGVLGRYAFSGQLHLVFDPSLSIAITERDGMDVMGMTVGGNEDVLDLPVWLWFAANAQLGLYGSIGIAGPLDGFGDAYAVPLGVGASYAIDAQLSIGGDLFFFDIGDSLDGRALGLRVAYAL